MPKANYKDSQKLARLSPDCSFLLTHLIRQNDGKSDEDACKILKMILDVDSPKPKPCLKKSSIGWYSSCKNAKLFNPDTGNFDDSSPTQAICFTESTLAGLKAHAEVFNSKFGIAFGRKHLIAKEANPCLNINESVLKEKIKNDGSYDKLFNYIPKRLSTFVNIINYDFDATHEREWRIPNDFYFSYKEIVFVFCPQFKFSEFSSKIQKDGRPVLFDLHWLEMI